jgi:pyruvate/2-oxoglutarate/acetoin dehydrogenase E1 component
MTTEVTERTITLREALNEALKQEMQRDETVFCMGEDIAIYGGAYGVTQGLMEEFGEDRIRDTAISEAAIVGAGIGAAMTGMRPVAELMYVDFIGIAMDQIYNQMGKIRYMFGGKATVPMVLRTQGGAGRSLGGQHSNSLEAWIIHCPGVKVVMPSTPYDAKGLLVAAIRDEDPVVFIEHKSIYNAEGPCPEEAYTVPIGEAVVRREGSDVTIVSYSRQAVHAQEAAEELAVDGIDCEVIDLRTLLPWDKDAVIRSVQKTNRLVVVEEGTRTGGVGAEIAATIQESAFDWLDAPIERVAGADVVIAAAATLEAAATPQVHDIIEAVRRVVR